MTTHIRTDDGAIGKSLKTTATKSDDTGETVCEVKVQMTVQRPEIDQLAGLPAGFASTFYDELGTPIANMELRFPKRELAVDGKLWRGDDNQSATLPLKNATADALRFKLEPNGAVLICRMTWRATGDETEEVRDLLGRWCSVDLTFVDPHENQEQLPLEGGQSGRRGVHLEVLPGGAGEESADALAEAVGPIARLAAQLFALGFDIPENEQFWRTVTPAELQRVHRFVQRSEAGGTPNTPSVLKPYKRKVN